MKLLLLLLGPVQPVEKVTFYDYQDAEEPQCGFHCGAPSNEIDPTYRRLVRIRDDFIPQLLNSAQDI